MLFQTRGDSMLNQFVPRLVQKVLLIMTIFQFLTLVASELPPAISFSKISSVVWTGVVQFSILAVDEVGLQKIEVFVNNSKIAEFTRAPFEVSIDTTRYPDGSYQITAIAYNSAGRVSSSNITVYFKNRSQTSVQVSQPKLLWTYEAVIERVKYNFRNVPAVGNDGTLYIAAYDTIKYNNFLFAISRNGTLRWRYEVGSNFAGPVVGPDGTVYINTGRLIAIGPNGYKRWEILLSKDSLPSSENYQYTPVIDTSGNIYVSTREALFAVNPSGVVKWNFQVRTEVRPVVDKEGVVYVVQGMKLIAIDSNGKEKWRVDTGGIASWLCLGDGVILVYQSTPKTKLVAISKQGEVLGRTNMPTLIWMASAGVTIGKDGTIYGINTDEKLVALTPDGTQKWAFDIPEKFTLAGSYIILTGNNERVTLIGESGIVYVGSPDAVYGIENGQVIFRLQVANPINKPLVMTDDGILYAVSHLGTVIAFQTNDKPAQSPWPMAGRNYRNANSE